jgi:hypothetical protein
MMPLEEVAGDEARFLGVLLAEGAFQSGRCPVGKGPQDIVTGARGGFEGFCGGKGAGGESNGFGLAGDR